VISSAISTLTLSLVIVALAAVYLLPTLVALARHIPGVPAIAVINILLGWSFIGWVIALALAVRSVQPASPVIQVVQHFPPPGPGPLPGAGWAGPPGAPPPDRDGAPPPLILPPRPPASGRHPAQPGQP
jgi:hypothetical protein